MNDVLKRTIEENCPKFNKNVVEGTAKYVLKVIPEFFDDIIKSSIRSLSPSINLTYEGYRRLTPKEEFNRMIVSDINKTTYDLAVSDLYMVEYIFKYNNEIIRRPLYLPFTNDGNIIQISNTKYSIVPVLSDTVISPSYNEVFVRLLKDKLTFKSTTRNFIINGEKQPGQIVYTRIVKTSTMNLSDNIGKPLTAVSLYLLGEYGFKETMKRYCKTDKYVITNQDTTNLKAEYNIFESTRIKPRSLKEYGYNGHEVKICLHKSIEITPFLENFIFGIIYTLDILPEHADDMITVSNMDNIEEERLYWRIMLGRITYKNSFSIDRIVDDMNEHFDTLQGYLDNLIKTKLRENGIRVNNFFDLLVNILDNYNIWLINSKEYNSDINNRYIDMLYYIMYDIIVGFNKVILNINKRAGKKANLSQKEIVKIFTNELSPRKIFTLVKSQSQNLALMLCDSSTDIKYPKVTALLEDQSRGNGVKRGSKTQFPESTKTLKGHDLYLGSLLFLTKTAPSPRFRANLYMNYDVNSGRLIIPKDIERSIEKLDIMLRGRMENAKIETFEVEDVE